MPKTATSTAKVPVIVKWKCSQCGCENSQPHTLVFQASTEATLLANDEKLKAKAREKLQASLPSQINKIVQDGEYGKAKMNLACAQCSKKELWSQYKTIPKWIFIVLGIGLLLLLADTYILNTEILGAIGVLAAFIPLVVMAIYTAIANKALTKKIKAIPEESKPHFYMIQQ